MTVKQREIRLSATAAPAEGEVRLLEIGTHRVGLFRVAGTLHALADRCPHRGAPICSAGELATEIVVAGEALGLGSPQAVLRCPWHKWDFEIATGRCAVDSRLQVRRYAVRTEGDEIVVSLDRP
jgi:nitrite reductase (NADH) small subunit